jgi:hypothetical protein
MPIVDLLVVVACRTDCLDQRCVVDEMMLEFLLLRLK